MSNQSLIKSLYRREIKVLYWKCKGEQYQQIALRFIKKDGSPYTDEWVQKQVTSAYKRLLVPPALSKEEKSDYLDQHFCEEILKFTDEELNAWPLYGWEPVGGDGHTAYEEKTKKDLPGGKETEIRQLSESVGPDGEADISQREDTDQSFDNTDEEDKLETSGWNEIEEVEEKQEEPSEGVSPRHVPPITESASPSPNPESPRGFEWRPPPNQPLNRLWLLVPALICIACVGLAWFARGMLLPLFTTAATSTPTLSLTNASTNTPQEPQPTQTRLGSPTPGDTSTPEASPTSTLSPTPEIPPTAISLPIREDFNTEYDPLWTVFGDPLLATASEQGKYLGYDGVLTVRIKDRAAIAIGNTSWTDYIILLRANHITSSGDVLLEVSFRMKDINNRIVLSCNHFDCNWIVIWNGVKDVLKEGDRMEVKEKLEITVVGDLFTATSTYNFSTQLGLPPKYQGQFDGGGVMVELFDYELDFIEIQEFR